ncbi:MAG TPA: hypothetical protein VEC16_05445, partial [Alphaproteobacteria bacterium]|nr:hypothetical protein [Alphaproteobacteria bacterium]
MISREKLEQQLYESWEDVKERYINPNIKKVQLVFDDKKVPTACFNTSTLETLVNGNFINSLVSMGMDSYDALVGVNDHEIGHYMVMPYNLAKHLVYLESANTYLKHDSPEFRADCINYFFDVGVNLTRMAREISGRELRETIITLTNKPNTSNVFNLISGFYESKNPFFKSPFYQSDFYLKNKEDMDKRIERLNSIDYGIGDERKKYKWNEGVYLSLFADIIRDIYNKEEGNSGNSEGKKEKGKESKNGSPGNGSGSSNGDSDSKKINPLGNSTPNIIETASRKALQDALDEIAREVPRKAIYDRIKEFVENKRGESMNKRARGTHGPGIGLDHSEITANDDLIDFYERKSNGFNLYIFKKPLMTNDKVKTPFSNNNFTPEDPFHKLNPFSSPFILPGISKKIHDIPLPQYKMNYDYPKGFISLDTSGSMRNPANGISYAVLTGFVLAKNYHANGAGVGVFNFSVDSQMLMPTRKLDDVYHLLCAYFGGGTSYNVDKVKAYLSILEKQDEKY